MGSFVVAVAVGGGGDDEKKQPGPMRMTPGEAGAGGWATPSGAHGCGAGENRSGELTPRSQASRRRCGLVAAVG